jgi:hypothetical protein
MARPKIDRPKLTKTISVRLTDEQHADFLKKLAPSGLNESQWMRRAILANETAIIAAPVQTEADRRLLFINSKASNNVNQLAHAVNYARIKGDLNEKLCLDLLTRLDLILHYMKASR